MPRLPAAQIEIPCNATAARKATRRLTQLYDDALEPSGLRSTQFTILAELDLRTGDPPTMRELAEALVMDRSSLGHTVRPLERDGLISLVRSTEDARRQHVVLTRAGKAKFREGKRLWAVAQKRFEDVFGEPGAAKLRATLLSIAREDRLTRLTD